MISIYLGNRVTSQEASKAWDSFLGLLYLNSARVRLCPGKVKGLNVGGFPTQTNVNGLYAYNWGSRGRRFKSCQPDWSGTGPPPGLFVTSLWKFWQWAQLRGHSWLHGFLADCHVGCNPLVIVRDVRVDARG
jgi:hypothetical protein